MGDTALGTDDEEQHFDKHGKLIDEDRYTSEAAYRCECGPNIDLWGEYGLLESLLGLPIHLDFGPKLGCCKGIVHAIIQNNESQYEVLWTCNHIEKKSNTNTTYSSVLNADDVLTWHFQTCGTEPPSWMDDKEISADLKASPLLTNPSSIRRLANFAVPLSAQEHNFPWMADAEERWETTIMTLNDPACACHYDPSGTVAYPVALLLTIILITKQCYDPSTKLPIVVTEDLEEVLEYADEYSQKISKPGRSHGRRELQSLGSIVKDIQGNADDDWEEAFSKTRALLLTLSSEFEEQASGDNYRYCNDPELIARVFDNMVLLFRSVLMHPEHALSAAQRGFLVPHLNAGPYDEMLDDLEEEDDGRKDAFEAWTALKAEFELN